MAEFNQNLWAPWRMEYINSLANEAGDGGCFLCRYAAAPEADREHLVIWRSGRGFTVFNRFPYASGHLLVAPLAHVGQLDDLDDATMLDVFRQVRDAQRLLREVTSCQGTNVGMNFGRCAGAGVPNHLHVHLVPRWEGDTNFMAVLSDTRVIPQSMETLREKMREAANRLGLPPVCG